jgi:F-type H+-transporting ATPase subunit delta
MKTSKQARREAKELYRCCLLNGRLDDGRVRAAVQKVIELKPRGYQGILGHFQRLVKLDLERRAAVVESATPLAEDLRSGIQASLGRQYGDGLSISFAQNAALIGGVRIKVGSDVFDGSIQARLTRLQEQF